jgi:hypothetical protein
MSKYCALSLTLLLAACGSDFQEGPLDDGGVTGDTASADGGRVDPTVTPDAAALPVDAAPVVDLAPPVDAPVTTEWNCRRIYTCSQGCGTDLACVGACNDQGCATARQATEALLGCLIESCGESCLGGFDAQCEGCLSTICAATFNACQSHSC